LFSPYLQDNKRPKAESDESDLRTKGNGYGTGGNTGGFSGEDLGASEGNESGPLNRSVIDYIIDIESTTSIFEDFDWFDLM